MTEEKKAADTNITEVNEAPAAKVLDDSAAQSMQNLVDEYTEATASDTEEASVATIEEDKTLSAEQAMESIVQDYLATEGLEPLEPKPTDTLQRLQLECDEIYRRMAKEFYNKAIFSQDEEVVALIEQFNKAIIQKDLIKLAQLASGIQTKLTEVMHDEDVYFHFDTLDEKHDEASDPKYAHYKQLIELNKMCTQLRLHLELQAKMQEWQQAINNNKQTPLTEFKNQIENTSIPNIMEAHPDTILLLNRCYLEANGWLEARKLMEEYKQLEKILGVMRYMPVGHKREIWKKKRDACYKQLQGVAYKLGKDINDLIVYTEYVDYLARRPFSPEWFATHSQDIDSKYFNQETQELTEYGIKKVNHLLSIALNPRENEIAMPMKIYREDLLLLTHYLGRDNMEKYCQLLELKGDGTHDHPFTVDNLRVILMGMARYRNRDLESPQIKNLLDTVTRNAKNKAINLGQSDRIRQTFHNRSQNALPENPDKTVRYSNIFYNFQRWAREYSYEVVDTSNERYATSFIVAGNPIFLLVLAIFSALTHHKMDNDAAQAYRNIVVGVLASPDEETLTHGDSEALQASPEQYLYSGTEAENKIQEVLVSSKDYESFGIAYPMFSEEFANPSEVAAFKNYFNERNEKPGSISQEVAAIPKKIKNIIKDKAKKMEQLARAESISHDYAYLYVQDKENLEFDLRDKNLNPMKFSARNIIDAGSTGLGVTFFTPLKNQVIHDNRIPLIIIFPGTHNQPGLIRDLESRSPGKSEWSNPKYKEAFLDALNKQIAELIQRHGAGAKISIELFGHSLGGSDALQAELLILEAMGQNMMDVNPEVFDNYSRKIDEIFPPSEQEELANLTKNNTNPRRKEELQYHKKTQQGLREGLESALGYGGKGRDYKTMDTLFKNEDRRIKQELRNNINQTNIAVVSTVCNRGSGIGEADAYAASALMGFVTEDIRLKNENGEYIAGESDHIEIEETAINFKGDPLRKGISSKYFGAAFIDPLLAPFRKQSTDPEVSDSIPKANQIKVSDVQVETGLGTRGGGFLNVWGENKLSPLLAHIGRAFGGNHYAHPVQIREAMNPEENKEYRNLVSEKWLSSQNIVVRGFKTGLHGTAIVARVLLEFVGRIFVLKLLPSTVGILLGSRDYDASYTSDVDINKGKRAKMKSHAPIHFHEHTSALDKGIISISHVNRMNQFIQEHSTDTSKINAAIKAYEDKTIDNLPDFDELPGPDGHKLYMHLHHQYIKANQYLHQWNSKADKMRAENPDDPMLLRLESEIIKHGEFVDKLKLCFENNRLNPQGCLALLRARADVINNDQYVNERNEKTISLETKVLMPLIMSVQKQELNELENNNDEDSIKKRKQLKKTINEYRKYLLEENYLSQRVMSSKWLNDNSQESPYLDKKEDGRYEINQKGYDKLKQIITKARTNTHDNAINDPFEKPNAGETDELVLLGHFFGRRCVKKVMDRYGLKGDGSPLAPFSLDNVRALLLGAAALYNPDYVQGVPEQHHNLLLDTNKETLRRAFAADEPAAAYLRLFDNFVNYEQNEFAKSAGDDPRKFFRSFGRGFGRAYKAAIFGIIKFVNNWGSANMTSVVTTGNLDPVNKVLGASVVGGVLDMLTPENPALDNFTQDLRVLRTVHLAEMEQAKKSEPKKSGPSVDEVVNEIMQVYKQYQDNVDGFIAMYPMFKDVTKFTQDSEKEQFIKQRVEQINDWGRAEQMAVVHCMHLQKDSDGYGEFRIPNKEGKPTTWNMKSVTDTGIPLFRFNCFWPKDKQEPGKPITLMIAIPEDFLTADIHKSTSPLSRMIALFRAGHHRLESGANMEARRRADRIKRKSNDVPEQEFKDNFYQNEARRQDAKRRIMQAINDEIEKIERVHGPNAEINIELFGRGIAATQCLQLELYILEALAARKEKNESFNFDNDPNGHKKELNKGLREGLNKPIFKDKRQYPQIGHITKISTYAKSPVGEPQRSAQEHAALIGYLACNRTDSDPGLAIEHNIFNTEGDPSAYFGARNAAEYLDTESDSFKNKPIQVNYVEARSGRGVRNFNWFYNFFMKGNYDPSDLTYAPNQFSGTGCYYTNAAVLTDNKEVRAQLCEQSGHKNKNKFFSEMSASLGYHVRSFCLRAIANPGDVLESAAFRFYQHPITTFIGKTVRSFVYQKPFSSKYDADANATEKREKEIHKKKEMQKDLSLDSTFFKAKAKAHQEETGYSHESKNTRK